MSLTFARLREHNVYRCEMIFHPLNAWSVSDWAVAFAGEAGEVLNAVKKLRRHEDGTNTDKDPQTREQCLQEIAWELADTIIYADLLAAHLEIDLGNAVRAKFNRVSMMRNFTANPL